MLLNIPEATKVVRDALPRGRIEAVVPYKDLYLFQVFTDEPGEGNFDPYYSVDRKTGKFMDFSIFADGNSGEIINLFVAARGGAK